METFRDTVNSYLGMLGRYASFNIRKRLIRSVNPEWWRYFTIAAGARKVVLKKKYTKKEIYKYKLKNIKSCIKTKSTRKRRRSSNTNHS